MPDPAALLLMGTDTSPHREFDAAQFNPDVHKRIVLPGAGRFGTATAVAKSMGAQVVEASDLSLFSTIIGYLCDPRHSLAELDVTVPDGLGRFTADAADDIELAAGWMIAAKFLSLPANAGTFMQGQRDAVWSGHKRLRAQLAAGLRDQVDILHGMRYDVADVRDVYAEVAQAGPEVATHSNIFNYKGGYTKQYGVAENAMWTCLLETKELDPAEGKELIGKLTDSEAFATAYIHHGLDNMPGGWTPLMALDMGKGRTDYVVANRDTGNRLVQPARRVPEAKKWPVYADQEIRPDSEIMILGVEKETCLHYRDLLVHKLGGTVTAERYCLMLIDGRVTTAFGLHCRDVVLLRTKYVGEVFGISITSDRYARLGKLFLEVILAGDMKKWLLREFRMLQRCEPVGIQTPSPTERHEGKTDRGVLKLVKREPRPGGGFQLLYRGDFRDDTWAETLARWQAQYAWMCRPGWDGPKLEPPVQRAGKKRRGRGASRQDGE